MIKIISYILSLSLILFSCRKDDIIIIDHIEDTLIIEEPHCIGDYNMYSSAEYDYVWKLLFPIGPTGHTAFYPDEYSRGNPVFNPNNPYEIVYQRKRNNTLGQEYELWVFSFCTGEANKIATNMYYNLDWGSNGWIIYTGTGHQIYKVKSNGDSLSVITNQSGFNRAGKWNPSGTLFWNNRDDGITIQDINGEIEHTLSIPFDSRDWVDDSTLIGTTNGFHLYKLSIPNDNLISLHNATICYSCPSIYDRKHHEIYLANGGGLYRYSLDGTNQIELIKAEYPSYQLGKGSYQPETDKIVINLMRADWKDSINADHIWVRGDALLLDSDGSNDRIINLE